MGTVVRMNGREITQPLLRGVVLAVMLVVSAVLVTIAAVVVAAVFLVMSPFIGVALVVDAARGRRA